MSRCPKKRCAVCGRNIVLDPLVDPGDPPHRYQACTAAHPTRAHHRMVILAKSSPSRSAPRPSPKENATVMLASVLILKFLCNCFVSADCPGAEALDRCENVVGRLVPSE